MKRIIFFALITIITISSCTEEVSCEEDCFENAIIRDFGNLVVDGCGWVVDISSKIYKPENLPSEFEIDELEVKIKYDTLSSKANCGFVVDFLDEIYINEIYRK